MSPTPTPAAHRPHRGGAKLQIINLLAVILPFVGFVAAVVLLWGVAFDWVHLALLGGMYIATAIGVTVGYHRLFTHRSFTTVAPVKFILGVLGSMAVEGPIIRWAAQHRLHHQCSDAEGDPHTPHGHGDGVVAALKGFWHAHMGWIVTPPIAGLGRYVPDLHKDRTVRFVSQTFTLWVILGLLIPAALGGLITMTWTGAPLGFLWGGLGRVFLVHHATWSINSVCHIWGTRPFRSHDESRNNLIFGVIGLGEGWHNNHHAFPASARHGLRWWEIDLSYLIIRTLVLFHLASEVRVPTQERIQAQRASDLGCLFEPGAPRGQQYCLSTVSQPGHASGPGATPSLSVVIIAGSAGGLTAMKRILQTIPPRLDAAVLLLLHMDPNHRSLAAALLGRHTSMHLREASEGDLLAPGEIFVAAPGRHLLVSPEGRLSTSGTERVRFVRPSADVLFESAAQSLGARVIAVVLTGTGFDGARGVEAVKAAGGRVVVQDPGTAEFDGMPHAAVRTGAADWVLPLEAIGPMVADLVGTRAAGATDAGAQ